ncbi:hypothetical protein JRI60_47300 [Archangium violaceum]|uniref:hypothetical protein n=1 Tax=Archangium violaceum TaxID=83451 RepID=UPI00195217F7|nr:hypothetical protein [Archangium violaceum]QRN96530.1 hypothetical protein JRI60_47300 [Archangium violaceum]
MTQQASQQLDISISITDSQTLQVKFSRPVTDMFKASVVNGEVPVDVVAAALHFYLALKKDAPSASKPVMAPW